MKKIQKLNYKKAVSKKMKYDLTKDKLVLHSLISKEAWLELTTTGKLQGKIELVEEYHLTSYRWLMQEAEKRVKGAKGTAPIWFWANITRKDLLVNIKYALECEPDSVLIECKIPKKRVLLSEYDDWHAVLNDSYVPSPKCNSQQYEKDLDDWYDEYDEAVVLKDKERISKLEQRKLDSWQQIFDLSLYNKDTYVQATVEEVRLFEVKKAFRLKIK